MELAQIKKILNATKLIQRLVDERQTEAKRMMALGDTAESGVLIAESSLLLQAIDVLIERTNKELDCHER